ncbi:unnamed protein product [Phytomonas sp. EM1]|nr:unnamed protein product [Phytomonas sp. EM1]|eukprot:CCW63889.1 unnamed protein product [Phytomonas sp. isolate EM1]
MIRRTFGCFVASSARTGGGSAPDATPSATARTNRLSVLHKLLIGEVQFRNRALLKVCNLEHSFGAGWRSEIESYTATLPPSDANLLRRQLARVDLTRFTTRELAMYGGEGPTHLASVAREANLAQGKAFLDAKGVKAFEAYVKAEATNANWSQADRDQFIKDVKALK